MIAVEADIFLVEILAPNTLPSLGEEITINCTATVMADVMHSPMLTLTHPNGNNIKSSIGSTLSLVLESSSTVDAGEYTCSGQLLFPELNNVSLFAQQKANISFKCKLN